MQQFDLVIAGGGAVGCALALALSQRTSLKIALVEKQSVTDHDAVKANQQKSSFDDARVVALAEQTWQFLTSLGIDQALKPIVTPIKHIHVSDRGHLGHCELSSDEYEIDALGYVCSLSALTQILENALMTSNVTWFRPETIEQVSQYKDFIEIKTHRHEIQASLLVIAEGGDSGTRKLLGFVPRQAEYEQIALVTNVKTNRDHENIAYERFTEDGPLAFLPMGKHDYSVVWSLNKQDYEYLHKLPEHEFLKALQEAFGYRAGIFEQCSKRQCFPLKLVTLNQATGHRCALAGNALHTLHPIAGQGLNLGLRDIDELVRQVVSEESHDIGNFGLLHRYQQARIKDQKRVIDFTDGLVRCFSNQLIPLVMGRNIGLCVMQFSPLLKQPLARQAMGHSAVNKT
jgi:2-octaprenyl-6-methoxyphenol hydroxylase